MRYGLALSFAGSLLTGCGPQGAGPAISEPDREAFRAVYTRAYASMEYLALCQRLRELDPSVEREIEIRRARLGFLQRDASRHGLGPDTKLVEDELHHQWSLQRRGCFAKDAALTSELRKFDEDALAVLDRIERVERAAS